MDTPPRSSIPSPGSSCPPSEELRYATPTEPRHRLSINFACAEKDPTPGLPVEGLSRLEQALYQTTPTSARRLDSTEAAMSVPFNTPVEPHGFDSPFEEVASCRDEHVKKNRDQVNKYIFF